MSQPSIASRGLDLINDWYDMFESWILTDKRSLYGASLARILSGCAVMGILITNFRVRNLLFGQGSVWNKPLQESNAKMYWPPRLIVDHMGNTTFLFYYLLVIFVALLFVLGWHTRLVGPLMLIGHVSIIERIPVLGDQGDNILRVGLLLLLFMHTSEHWSLDARRRARHAAEPMGRGAGGVGAVVKNLYNSHRVLPLWFTNGVHNVVLIALAWQLIMIYFSAGWFKAQGELWYHGTALYYPLQLQEYKPFPFLTDAFTHVGVMVGLSTYVADGRADRLRLRAAAPDRATDRDLLRDHVPPVHRGPDGAAVVLAVDDRVRCDLREHVDVHPVRPVDPRQAAARRRPVLGRDRPDRGEAAGQPGQGTQPGVQTGGLGDRRGDAAAGQHQRDDRQRQHGGGGVERAEAADGDHDAGQQAAECAGQVHREVGEALNNGPVRDGERSA